MMDTVKTKSDNAVDISNDALVSRRRFLKTAAIAPFVVPMLVTGGLAIPDVATAETVRVNPLALAIHKVVVAGLNNQRLAQGMAIYQPIWSDGSAIYIADSLKLIMDGPNAGNAQSVIVRIPKSGGAAQSTNQTRVNGAIAVVDTENNGHRGSTIMASDLGSIFHHHQSHIGLWAGESTRLPRKLDERTPTQSYSGILESSAYRRIFRDPYTGAIYLVCRGSSAQAKLALWDEQRQEFASVLPQGQDGMNDITQCGAYGHEIAFAKPPTPNAPPLMYCAPEFCIKFRDINFQ